MTEAMSELRMACEHGRFDAHFVWDANFQAKEPCSGGHPAEVEKVWYCTIHKEIGDWTEPPYQMLQCSIGAERWASSVNAEPTCVVEGRFLIPLSAPKPEREETETLDRNTKGTW